MTSPALKVRLQDISSCFEGVIPSSISTVAADGTPNVTYLSIVHRIDDEHVALSRQFFKKTEENTHVNPYACVSVIEPATGRQFQLDLVFERTETEGPLFERMRTRLDAVAADEGMSNVFKLRGVDICRVIGSAMIPCEFPESRPRPDVNIEKMEAFSHRIADASDMDELLSVTLKAWEDLLGFRHAFIMLVDESGDRLYTVASSGYQVSGAGSEVRLGEGIIGLAAARRQSIRVTHMGRDLSYSHAVRESAHRVAAPKTLEQVIPLPTLPSIQSQLVTPMLAYHQLVGVICLQSPTPGAFQAADECVVGILANQVAMAMANLRPRQAAPTEVAPAVDHQPRPLQVRHYSEDDSIFVDNEYLIKGVAGGILWRLLRHYQDEQRVEFSNKEIRLDQTLELPDIKDNLEARLILLRKRLEERCDHIQIEKTGRGRFRLAVNRPLTLVQVEGGGPL